MRSVLQVSLILILSVVFANSQFAINQGFHQIRTSQAIKVDVDLTLVNATVADRRGHPVRGLGAQNFKIWEDKVQQNIEYFSAEDIPVSLGLILDVSGSMRNAARIAHEAAVSFLKEGNRDDEYFLVEFSDRPVITDDFTTDIQPLENRISSAPSTGKTALLDAIHLAIENLRHGNRLRKALLLISDGKDNSSRYSFREVKEFVREQDVPIYAIGIVPRTEGPSRVFHRNGRDTLEELSTISGGEAFFTDLFRDINGICIRIADDIRNQYVLGYKTTNAVRDGGWRKIRVKVLRSDGVSKSTAHAKSGYYAPTR